MNTQVRQHSPSSHQHCYFCRCCCCLNTNDLNLLFFFPFLEELKKQTMVDPCSFCDVYIYYYYFLYYVCLTTCAIVFMWSKGQLRTE